MNVVISLAVFAGAVSATFASVGVNHQGIGGCKTQPQYGQGSNCLTIRPATTAPNYRTSTALLIPSSAPYAANNGVWAQDGGNGAGSHTTVPPNSAHTKHDKHTKSSCDQAKHISGTKHDNHTKNKPAKHHEGHKTNQHNACNSQPVPGVYQMATRPAY